MYITLILNINQRIQGNGIRVKSRNITFLILVLLRKNNHIQNYTAFIQQILANSIATANKL